MRWHGMRGSRAVFSCAIRRNSCGEATAPATTGEAEERPKVIALLRARSPPCGSLCRTPRFAAKFFIKIPGNSCASKALNDLTQGALGKVKGQTSKVKKHTASTSSGIK